MYKVYKSDKKLACITLDYEKDYGYRINEFNILDQNVELDGLVNLFKKLNIPLSLFVTTNIFEDYPSSFELAAALGDDFHSHSHTHNTFNPDAHFEINESKLTFEKYFGCVPLGYRAPQGVLGPNDLELLNKYEYKFSSSVFPSLRPGKYNNIFAPVDPVIYENGFVEMPFSVIKKIRYTYSLSYFKLMGKNLNKLLISSFGLPNIVVFDSHLHDYIYNEKSFNQLPPLLKVAFSVRKSYGKKYIAEAVKILKHRGYEFITMTELYEEIKNS